MFQWAALVLDTLLQSYPITKTEDLEIIHEAPQELNVLYSQKFKAIWDRLRGPNRRRSQLLFHWLACGARPLSIPELDDAINIVLDDIRSPHNIYPDRLDRQRILDLGGVLVSVTKSQNSGGIETFALAHSSIKDYVLNTANCAADNGFPDIIQSASQINATLAHACLTYLCYEDHAYGPSPAAKSISTTAFTDLFALDSQMTEDFDAWVRNMPLQQYPTFEWAAHHVASGAQTDLVSHALRRFCLSEKDTIRWLQVCQMELPLQLYNRLRSVFRPEYSPGHLLQSLKQVDRQIGAHSAEFTTWLEHFAVEVGTGGRTQEPKDQNRENKVTRWSKAMTTTSAVQQQIGWGVYACLPVAHTAAFFDFLTYLAEYLSDGGDPNARAYLGATLLHLATQGDAMSSAEVMCRNADTVVDLEDVAGCTPLYYATRECLPELVDLLEKFQLKDSLGVRQSTGGWYSG